MRHRIVIDTNVIISALRSNKGASFLLLQLIDSGKFEVNVSVPLVFEYEALAKRFLHEINLNSHDIEAIINYICKVSHHQKIHYLWRPLLKDPQDDMILELAVASGSDFIITFNKIDFSKASQFGILSLTPQEFLRKIGEIS